MKRRSILGLIAAALCPTPPPGLPKVGKPGPQGVTGFSPRLNDMFSQHAEAIQTDIHKHVTTGSPWVALTKKA